MTLKEWFDTHPISRALFCRQVKADHGVTLTRSALCRYVLRNRTPNPLMAAAIVAVTDGKCSVGELKSLRDANHG